MQAVGVANTVIVQTALDEVQCHTVTGCRRHWYSCASLLPPVWSVAGHLLSQTANKKTGKCPCISIREVQEKNWDSNRTVQIVASRTRKWWVRHDIRNFWNGKRYYLENLPAQLNSHITQLYYKIPTLCRSLLVVGWCFYWTSCFCTPLTALLDIPRNKTFTTRFCLLNHQKVRKTCFVHPMLYCFISPYAVVS